MSKSLKNYVEVGAILEDYPAEVLRLFILGASYRSQMDYSPDALDEAKAVWERFRSFVRIAPVADVADTDADARLEAFGAAMDDDLNTPGAIAALHDLVREGHSAVERRELDLAGQVRAAVVRGLDVLGCAPADDARTDLVGPLVTLLLEQREAARATKDFARADEIRAKLAEIGVQVEDSPEGARWYLA
jgi:cysteinyl-tRNA synthetase